MAIACVAGITAFSAIIIACPTGNEGPTIPELQAQLEAKLNAITVNSTTIGDLRGQFEVVNAAVLNILAGVKIDTDVDATVKANEANLQEIAKEAIAKKENDDLKAVRDAAREWVEDDPIVHYFEPRPNSTSPEQDRERGPRKLSVTITNGVGRVADRVNELGLNATHEDIEDIIIQEINAFLENRVIRDFSVISDKFVNPLTINTLP